MAEFQATENFYIEHCCSCGMAFAVTQDFYKSRRNDHGTFYCPSGHSQYYAVKSETEKAREETKKVQAEVDRLKNCIDHKKDIIRSKDYQVRHFKGEVTKLKKQLGA